MIDYMIPDFCKLLFAVSTKECKATNEDFLKLEKCSKYQFDEMMKENDFGLKEEFYHRLKFS